MPKTKTKVRSARPAVKSVKSAKTSKVKAKEGKKSLIAKKMQHMREIANINKQLGISKTK